MNKKLLRETIFVTIANLTVAIIINVLAWQFKLVSGGMLGYALVINYLVDIPPGIFTLIFNIVLLIVAFLLVGKGVGGRAVYGFVSLSVFVDTTRYVLNLTQDPIDSFPQSLLFIIILSISMGTAVSVVLANNYSVGSYSTIFIIVEKYIRISAQKLFFTLDFILAMISGIIFGLDRGVLLVINAVVAYFVVKLLLPRAKTFFN